MEHYTDLVTYIVAAAAAVGAFWKVMRSNDRKTSDLFRALASEITESIPKTTSEPPLDAGRIAAVERRMEELEADAKRYLAKANTRLQRARKLAGEDDEDSDEGEVPQELIQQGLAELNGQAQPDQDRELSLADIRKLGQRILS